MEDLKKIDEKMETLGGSYDRDCVIVDKVFASCKQRECFPEIEVDIDDEDFGRIRFRPGFIVPNTLIVSDIEGQPDFRRARFLVRIPFQVLDDNGNIILESVLPDIEKDIILYIPDARDEFEFRIVIETSSIVLAPPVQTGDILSFSVGVYLIVKVVGTVQLWIPAFGYCPTPPDCTEFSPDDICEDFDVSEFPEFFPPQLSWEPQ